MGIRAEIHSINFYEGLKKLVPQKDREIVNTIIAEEKTFEDIRKNKGKFMKNIKIYTTPSYPYCIRVKQFLKDNNVEFEDIDVSSSQEKAQEMINKSGQMGVPVLDIGGEIIVEFDKGVI